ncbi:hypothetical protein, partial [Acidovorax sp. sic0104]|uniref:hypothetical protein n=1 Tax=Acidovorax sp. sic0104 TaxID=2854784 RepID=UPI001C48C653
AGLSTWLHSLGGLKRLYQLLQNGSRHEEWIAFRVYAIIRDATTNTNCICGTFFRAEHRGCFCCSRTRKPVLGMLKCNATGGGQQTLVARIAHPARSGASVVRLERRIDQAGATSALRRE